MQPSYNFYDRLCIASNLQIYCNLFIPYYGTLSPPWNLKCMNLSRVFVYYNDVCFTDLVLLGSQRQRVWQAMWQPQEKHWTSLMPTMMKDLTGVLVNYSCCIQVVFDQYFYVLQCKLLIREEDKFCWNTHLRSLHVFHVWGKGQHYNKLLLPV